tara:strand:+ start:46 stop:909 length:864 start_codon:yes stop_codon:yes gene_type:complete
MAEWIDKRIESLANLVQSAFLNEEEKERFREDLASFHLLKLSSLHLKQLIKLKDDGAIGSDQFWSEWEKLAHPHKDRLQSLLKKGRINFNEELKECAEIGFVEEAYDEDFYEFSNSPNAELTNVPIVDHEKGIGSKDLDERGRWRKWWLGHFVVREGPAMGMLATQDLPQFINRIEILKNEAFLLEKTSEGELARILGEEAVNLAVNYLLGEPRLNPKTGKEAHDELMLGLGSWFVKDSFSGKHLISNMEYTEYSDEGWRISDAIEALKEDILWLQAEFARERSEDN